jgi:hypothetical protein
MLANERGAFCTAISESHTAEAKVVGAAAQSIRMILKY